MMGYPSLTMPTYAKIAPGTVVEHQYSPGVPIVVLSGTVAAEWGERYIVKLPDNREERVLRKILIV
jgi:hypothetical protein